MPSRRRPKSPSSSPAAQRPTTAPTAGTAGATKQSDVERFAAALKDSEQAERAQKARQQQERADAASRAEQAAAHANALTAARRELERAVDAVRTAKQVGRGRAEADEAWKVAKALVIELETGTAPTWAPKPTPVAEAVESADAGGEGDDVAVEVPLDAD